MNKIFIVIDNGRISKILSGVKSKVTIANHDILDFGAQEGLVVSNIESSSDNDIKKELNDVYMLRAQVEQLNAIEDDYDR